ncbi:YiiX/YebB-like N1pC/P60 family cysteine hydrolase [Rickettsiales bacterium LUAb2]
MQLHQIKAGDLIFTGLINTNNNLTNQIQNVGLNFNDLPIDHVGLYIGNKLVVEAIPPSVKLTSLNQFLLNNYDNKAISYFVIKRPKANNLVKKAIDFALFHLDTPYNDYYLKNNNQSFYCSELIIKAFKYANNNCPYFEEHIMEFTPKNSTLINSLWINMYGGKNFVPINEYGSHPASLIKSKQLI